MRTAVIGPGAVGCLFAALLKEKDIDLWLVDHVPQRARLIATQGILVESDSGVRRVPVRITASPNEVGPIDTVLLCVKSYDTHSAVESIQPMLHPGTTIVSLQNGAGNLETIASLSSRRQAACAITSHGTTLLDHGHVRHCGSGPITVASLQPEQQHRTEAIADLLRNAAHTVSISHNAASAIWGKLITNSAINPLSAISGKLNGELLDDPILLQQLHHAAQEGQAVAGELAISLPYPDAVAEVERVCRATATNSSSMQQDLKYGRRTEIDAICGAIVKAASQHDIQVPVTSRFLNTILAMEADNGETHIPGQ